MGRGVGLLKPVFSFIKRTFNEYVYSVKLQNMVSEMMLKRVIV
jgi:hypothetical protein